MFSGRRFAIRNPVKPSQSDEYRIYKSPSYSYKKRRSYNSEGGDYDEYEDGYVYDRPLTGDHNDEDNSSISKSPPTLRFIYIVSQSNTDILGLATDKVPNLCIDKVISVHTTKISANEAAKAHLREICGVRSSTDVEEMEGGVWENVEEYHEGIGARGMFVGSMKSEGKRGKFVRVETQKWKVR